MTSGYGKNTEKKNIGFKAMLADFIRLHTIDALLTVYDLGVAFLSFFLALWFRFDCRISELPAVYMENWLRIAPIYGVLTVAVHCIMRLYQSIWRFAGLAELKRILGAAAILFPLHLGLCFGIFGAMPISYFVVGSFIQIILVCCSRFFYRFVAVRKLEQMKRAQDIRSSRVMLIGAGSAGQAILRDISNAEDVNEIVCVIIDDDKKKHGRYLEGVPIAGGREDILFYAEKYKIEKIYLTMPEASAEERRDILDICKETGCELKSLPGIADIVSGKPSASAMRDVDIEDLLGRETVSVDTDLISSFILGKVILVTGGGGSIGSELCRQIAKHHPRMLIVFDIYENNAHSIGLELRDKYPELELVVLIGSVRDAGRIHRVFEKYKPEVVYHAAAHKHVPLMEDSPCESIKNNVAGTYNTAYAAMVNGCKRFVLISTDKAVNPTNVMGASKRLCEMTVQSFDKLLGMGRADKIAPPQADHGVYTSASSVGKCCATEFVAVRFGNVLGSNGSVVPRFKEQIARGGPVTVTHPDVIRYFMTIPEAANLVLQAGAYAEGGEIFVLDMGAPVKIDTLARNLIRLSGLRPDVDIKISYTGLRPGEKLYEEKLMSEEGLKTTPNKLIHVASPLELDLESFLGLLGELIGAAFADDEKRTLELVAEAVDTYHPAGEHGSELKGEVYDRQLGEMRKRDSRRISSSDLH